MQVTLEQVRDIVNGSDGNQNAQIASLSEIDLSTSYSYTTSQKSYHVALSGSDRSYLLLVSPLASSCSQPATATPPGPITLLALSTLLSKILDDTAVPIPRPIAHGVPSDDGKWCLEWLLLRIPASSQTHLPMSLASVRHELSPRQLARLELRLGTYLRALHGITNDWFGIPMDKPTSEPTPMPSFTTLFIASKTGGNREEGGEDITPYSWQDAFVLQLEELFECVCGNTGAHKTTPYGHRADLDVDVDDLRRLLSRAIGSFLFDDVEMPRLVWVTGNDKDVIVSLTRRKEWGSTPSEEGTEDTEAEIAYILPTFGHALWADPLMEAWFLPPGPTAAINEGYFGGEEDGSLIFLPRHKTKRIWYTVYLALIILAEGMSQGEERVTQASGGEMVRWATNVLPECVELLKNAPCY